MNSVVEKKDALDKTLPCIICEKQLRSILPAQLLEAVKKRGVNQPSGAVAFYSHGHFGSAEFDPGDGTMAEINICDECWVKKAKFIRTSL